MYKKIMAVMVFSFSCLSAMKCDMRFYGIGSTYKDNQEKDIDYLQHRINSVDTTKPLYETRDSRREVENCLWRQSSILRDYPCDKSVLYGLECCCCPIITAGTCCNFVFADECGKIKSDQCTCCYEIPEDIKLGCVMFMATAIVKDYKKRNSKNDI